MSRPVSNTEKSKKVSGSKDMQMAAVAKLRHKPNHKSHSCSQEETMQMEVEPVSEGRSKQLLSRACGKRTQKRHPVLQQDNHKKGKGKSQKS